MLPLLPARTRPFKRSRRKDSLPVKAHVARVVKHPLPFVLDEREQKILEEIRQAYNYYEHMQQTASQAHSGLAGGQVRDCRHTGGMPRPGRTIEKNRDRSDRSNSVWRRWRRPRRNIERVRCSRV